MPRRTASPSASPKPRASDRKPSPARPRDSRADKGKPAAPSGNRSDNRYDSRPGKLPAGQRPERRDAMDAPRAPRPARETGSRFPSASPWPRTDALFPPLDADARQALECLPEALHKIWPLNAAHRRSLPEDVAALSRLLTTERRDLRRPYWSSPAFVSAYLYYFLPWNLLRLTRLLAALPLPDPRALAPEDGEALLLDAGSGPLSLPLALWLARPQWREAPVRVLALDSAARPPELGKALFASWGACLGWKTWPVRTAQGPLESLARQAAPLLAGKGGAQRCRPWLVTAANVLNELRPGRKGGGGRQAWDEEPEDGEGAEVAPQGPLAERLDSLLDAFAPLLFRHNGAEPENAPESGASPALLFVEPGTRLGGNTIMRLRDLALEGGLAALAPCPHNAACPLLAGQGRRTWCHFTFDSRDAPDWLLRLSTEAGLAKSGLSLAPLLLGAAAEPEAVPVAAPGREKTLPARVLSAPFAVPGLEGRARYACTAEGLTLLEDAEALASGDRLPVRLMPDAPRDVKSRARIIRSPRAHVPAKP